MVLVAADAVGRTDARPAGGGAQARLGVVDIDNKMVGREEVFDAA